MDSAADSNRDSRPRRNDEGKWENRDALCGVTDDIPPNASSSTFPSHVADELTTRCRRSFGSQSSEMLTIGDVFEIAFDPYERLGAGFKEAVGGSKASKKLRNAIGVMRIWLHDLHARDEGFDRFLLDSSHLRVAVYMILFRIVRLFLRVVPNLDVRGDQAFIDDVGIFIELQAKILSECPEVSPRAGIVDDGADSPPGASISPMINVQQLYDAALSDDSSDSDSDDDDDGESCSEEKATETVFFNDHEEEESDKMTFSDLVYRFSIISDDFCSLANTLSNSMERAIAEERLELLGQGIVEMPIIASEDSSDCKLPALSLDISSASRTETVEKGNISISPTVSSFSVQPTISEELPELSGTAALQEDKYLTTDPISNSDLLSTSQTLPMFDDAPDLPDLSKVLAQLEQLQGIVQSQQDHIRNLEQQQAKHEREIARLQQQLRQPHQRQQQQLPRNYYESYGTPVSSNSSSLRMNDWSVMSNVAHAWNNQNAPQDQNSR